MNNKKYILTTCFVLLFMATSLFAFKSMKGFKISYSVPESDVSISGSNRTTTAVKNYVGDALPSTYSDSFKANFEVPLNYKDSTNTYALYTLSKNKLVPTNSESFLNVDTNINPIALSDAGLNYILKYGYSNLSNSKTVFNNPIYDNYKNGTNLSNDEKEYITQIAVWMYIYSKNLDNPSYFNSYCENNSCAFYETNGSIDSNVSYSAVQQAIESASNYNPHLKYITALLSETNGALTDTNTTIFEVDSQINTYTFDNENNTFITGPIKLKNINTHRFINWSASVIDRHDNGIYITDENGNRLTDTSNLNANSVIRLKVPIKDDPSTMQLDDCGVEITINEVDTENNAKSFKVLSTTDNTIVVGNNGTKIERFSDVLVANATSTSEGRLLYLSNFTIISKTDATNGEEIGGAHLQVFGINDMDEETEKPMENATPIEEWVSIVGQSHKFHLETGRYGLCETIAPEGYQLKETCVIFSVNNDSSVTAVAMENEPIPIPDTGLFKSKILYTVGGIFIVIGLLGIVIVLSKNKTNKERELNN